MSNFFEIVIGLEVHVQLNTQTKLFCSCHTSFGEEPNVNTCPICLGLPGVLPKLNKEAVIKAIKLGTAIKANINNNSIFERKNYFYPDSPSGYQISQLQIPIVETGTFVIQTKDKTEKIIRINRAHLETDAGKSIHEKDNSLVDLNRVGTPLLEIVTEPDFSHIDEVTDYLKKLQTLVRYLDISDGNMQEGSFRCDVNVSIRPKGSKELFTRVEIKNMNSFNFIEKAISYEVERQIEAWEDGVYEKEVVQETRLFDTEKFITKPMRSKEESSDYRYFPDPDLLKVTLTKEILEKGRDINVLPQEYYDKYVKECNISHKDAERIISDKELNDIFSGLLEKGFDSSLIITWLLVELTGRLKKENILLKDSPITITHLEDLMRLISKNIISGNGGKKIFDYLLEIDNSKSISELVKELNLEQITDNSFIEKLIEEVLLNNEKEVEEYKNGKVKLLGSFVGQVLKKSEGKANPKLINELLSLKLNS